MNSKLLLTPVVILAVQIACFAPAIEFSEEPLPTVTVHFPSVMKHGQEYSFIVEAIAGSSCYLGVGYYNLDSRWTAVGLPVTTANNSGTCEWKWKVPDDAKDGIAEIRGYIENQGKESRNLFPQTICIEKCP